MQAQNQYLDYLIDPSFQGTNRLFVSSLEDNTVKTGDTEYILIKTEIKDYNVLVDGQNFFNQPVQNDIRAFENI